MRKLTLIIVLISAIVVCASSLAKAEDTYTFGIMVSSNKQDAQLKVIFEKVIAFVEKQQNVRIDLAWYTEQEPFLKAAANKEFSLAYTKQFDVFVELLENGYYKPITSIAVFGRKEMQSCVYVAKDREVKTIDDLRGLRLMTYPRRDGYYPLRNLLGEDPRGFFSEIKTNTAGNVSLMELIKGETDVVLAYNVNLDFLKMANPSVEKKINELFCSEKFVNPGITRSDSVPESIITELIGVMKNARKHEALKQYRSLLKVTGLRFFPVKTSSYYNTVKFYRKAKQEGWDKEYEKWYEDMGRPAQ